MWLLVLVLVLVTMMMILRLPWCGGVVGPYPRRVIVGVQMCCARVCCSGFLLPRPAPLLLILSIITAPAAAYLRRTTVVIALLQLPLLLIFLQLSRLFRHLLLLLLLLQQPLVLPPVQVVYSAGDLLPQKEQVLNDLTGQMRADARRQRKVVVDRQLCRRGSRCCPVSTDCRAVLLPRGNKRRNVQNARSWVERLSIRGGGGGGGGQVGGSRFGRLGTAD